VAAIVVCKPTNGPMPALKYWRRTGQYGLVASDQVSAAAPYADFGGLFVPAAHT
jgi:hypothetical protein